MNKNKDAAKQYLEARKAIRGGKDPMAFLSLGKLYAQGIGTTENHVLANYFYEKALYMGSKEAERFISHEYDTGMRDIATEFIRAVNRTESVDDIPAAKMDRFWKQIEKERIKKNYGILSRLRDNLHVFYPDYDREQAFDDILNNRDTVNADICFAISNNDNYTDVDVDLVESLLSQLFAPITQDTDLYQRIIDSDNGDLLNSNVGEILQCLVNFTHAYNNICKKYKVVKKEINSITATDMFPYLNVPLMSLLRRQAFRCVLSIKDLGPYMNNYLEHLDSDDYLLNICETVHDEDIQLLLISYIELNIDLNIQQTDYLSLLRSFWNHDLDVLANHLNEFAKKLTDSDIEHQLPEFTLETTKNGNYERNYEMVCKQSGHSRKESYTRSNLRSDC